MLRNCIILFANKSYFLSRENCKKYMRSSSHAAILHLTTIRSAGGFTLSFSLYNIKHKCFEH